MSDIPNDKQYWTVVVPVSVDIAMLAFQMEVLELATDWVVLRPRDGHNAKAYHALTNMLEQIVFEGLKQIPDSSKLGQNVLADLVAIAQSRPDEDDDDGRDNITTIPHV